MAKDQDHWEPAQIAPMFASLAEHMQDHVKFQHVMYTTLLPARPGSVGHDLSEFYGLRLNIIAAYGPTLLFPGIAPTTRTEPFRLHYDTTSINVTGEYDSGFNTRLIQIVHGHSKDHRSNLKQFIISLVTNQHGFSSFMEPIPGNESEKKTLIRTIEEVRKNLVTDETIYHMADSALYSAENVAFLGDQCFWITMDSFPVRRTIPEESSDL